MKKEEGYVIDFIVRYAILIVVGILSFKVFYLFFTILTIYPTYLLFKPFFDAVVVGNTIFVNGSPIEIVGACVAGSAYFLLLILNLSTGGIKVKKRIGILLFSFFSFLFINVLRLFFLSILYVKGISFFDIAHRFLWYVGSIVFVIGIWFLTVKIFKIKEIPLYSDLLFLGRLEKKLKNSKRSKKH